MKIDSRLNLVVPVVSDDGEIYVHSMPISREVFEKYFLVISKTFSALYAEGLGQIAGPRVALMMLKKIASDADIWEGKQGVENGLMSEIRRLTNVTMLVDGGWTNMQYQDALDKKLIDQDDIDEIEGNIVFFICASAVHKRTLLPGVLAVVSSLWGTLTTSLNCTEFAKSLPTSTVTENTGGTAAALSIPS